MYVAYQIQFLSYNSSYISNDTAKLFKQHDKIWDPQANANKALSAC